jgi:hypothetical protein
VPNSHYCQQGAVTPNPGSSYLKRVPNYHHYLQQAVTPNWMGSIALREHITVFFSRVDKPSEDIASRLFFMNMKRLMLCDIVRALSAVAHALF